MTLDQAYTYDANGLIATSPQGDFTYDDRGLVHARVVTPPNNTSAAGTYTYGYDVKGRNNNLTYPDGHARTQAYDDEGRINQRCYMYPQAPGGPVQHCYEASYDNAGNPTTLTDPWGQDTVAYDNLDRVTSVSRTPTGDVETYAYNAMGALSENAGVALNAQRPLLVGSGNADSAVPNTYNGQAITLDGAGQITSLAGLPITYDGRGTLNGINGGGMHRDGFRRLADNDAAQLIYTYDGDNRSSIWSWSTTAPANWVQHDFWVYDGVDHPLEHDDASGNRQFYEVDIVGNVRRLMSPQGLDLGGYRYTAFGETYTDDPAFVAPTGVNALPVRWKGAWLMYSAGAGTSSAVDLYDMRARWWWPQGGVFVQIDGFRYADARSTLWGWPRQNPLRYWDPTGHDWQTYLFGGRDFESYILSGQGERDLTAGFTALEGVLSGYGLAEVGAAWGAGLGGGAALGGATTLGGAGAGAAKGCAQQAPVNQLVIDMEQLGQKFGEHMSDDPGYGSPEAYADLARSIYNNPNAVASIASNGDTLLQVGSNILRLQPDGSFRSLYPQQ